MTCHKWALFRIIQLLWSFRVIASQVEGASNPVKQSQASASHQTQTTTNNLDLQERLWQIEDALARAKGRPKEFVEHKSRHEKRQPNWATYDSEFGDENFSGDGGDYFPFFSDDEDLWVSEGSGDEPVHEIHEPIWPMDAEEKGRSDDIHSAPHPVVGKSSNTEKSGSTVQGPSDSQSITISGSFVLTCLGLLAFWCFNLRRV